MDHIRAHNNARRDRTLQVGQVLLTLRDGLLQQIQVDVLPLAQVRAKLVHVQLQQLIVLFVLLQVGLKRD